MSPTIANTQQPVVSKIADVLTGKKIRTGTDRARFYLGWAGSVFAVVTLIVLVWVGLSPSKYDAKATALPFLVAWTIAPPMYFWFDYFVLWRIESQSGTRTFRTLDEFKHGQELSRNLWVAIVALLAGIYFRPDA